MDAEGFRFGLHKRIGPASLNKGAILWMMACRQWKDYIAEHDAAGHGMPRFNY